MTRAVLLDSGPLGLLTAPPRKPHALACSQWLAGLIAAGVRIVVPEITDYELRRELLRMTHAASVRRLDALCARDGIPAPHNGSHAQSGRNYRRWPGNRASPPRATTPSTPT